jgi:hypothetical protein
MADDTAGSPAKGGSPPLVPPHAAPAPLEAGVDRPSPAAASSSSARAAAPRAAAAPATPPGMRERGGSPPAGGMMGSPLTGAAIGEWVRQETARLRGGGGAAPPLRHMVIPVREGPPPSSETAEGAHGDAGPSTGQGAVGGVGGAASRAYSYLVQELKVSPEIAAAFRERWGLMPGERTAIRRRMKAMREDLERQVHGAEGAGQVVAYGNLLGLPVLVNEKIPRGEIRLVGGGEAVAIQGVNWSKGDLRLEVGPGSGSYAVARPGGVHVTVSPREEGPREGGTELELEVLPDAPELPEWPESGGPGVITGVTPYGAEEGKGEEGVYTAEETLQEAVDSMGEQRGRRLPRVEVDVLRGVVESVRAETPIHVVVNYHGVGVIAGCSRYVRDWGRATRFGWHEEDMGLRSQYGLEEPPDPRDDFEANRSADWRDKLDGLGGPTCGPARATERGCPHCGGPLDATASTAVYVCPWCTARYPHRREVAEEEGYRTRRIEQQGRRGGKTAGYRPGERHETALPFGAPVVGTVERGPSRTYGPTLKLFFEEEPRMPVLIAMAGCGCEIMEIQWRDLGRAWDWLRPLWLDPDAVKWAIDVCPVHRQTVKAMLA